MSRPFLQPLALAIKGYGPEIKLSDRSPTLIDTTIRQSRSRLQLAQWRKQWQQPSQQWHF